MWYAMECSFAEVARHSTARVGALIAIKRLPACLLALVNATQAPCIRQLLGCVLFSGWWRNRLRKFGSRPARIFFEAIVIDSNPVELDGMAG